MKDNTSHRKSILYYLNILDEERDTDTSYEEFD
jgi:hypothetical protein